MMQPLFAIGKHIQWNWPDARTIIMMQLGYRDGYLFGNWLEAIHVTCCQFAH